MEKRMYKFYPDYKLKFSKILTTLGLSTHAEGGWILKVYENAGWLGTWKCFYESELYVGMEPWVKRIRKVASEEECHTTWKVYNANGKLIEKTVFNKGGV